MATTSEQSRIERVLALLFAVLMITAVFAPAVGATVTSGNDAAQDAVDTSQNDTAQTDEQSPSSQAEDETTGDNETESEATIDDATLDANDTVEVIVRVEQFDVPAASTLSSDAVVDELKAHAEESQQPIVDWVQSTEGVEVRNDYWLANALLLELDTDEVDVQELVAQPGVTDVHENFEVETPEPVERDDASDGAADTTYGLDQVNATEVWETYDTKGAGASVAVLDTGVDPDHPDIELDEENWAEFNDDGDEVDSEPYDSAEHGTHTSGTVAGGDASGEYIGVAPEVELMHGKVLDGGSGSFAAIIGGMEWAVEEDADVISMSLGSDGYSAQMIDPVRNAEDAGTLVVSSSGNSGEGTSGSPANVPESFAIGASDANANVADFSSGEEIDTQDAWGVSAPADWPDSYVVPDVAAPGVNVKSSVPGGGYDSTFSGTSMAAPHVSGAIALMLSASDDDPSNDVITSALEETAWKPAGEPGEQDTRYGHGIVDAKAATDRVAADSGVTGTVTNEAGDPIEGATITLDGVPRTTNASGQYMHRVASGEYDVTVDAFGYEPMETTVTVEDGNFTQEDFELASDLAVALAEPQPRSAQAGSSFTTSFDVANLESLTVGVEGYDAADATLSVDGETAAFGEPVTFDDPVSDTVTVTVETTADTAGHVELHHTFEGTDDSTELTTGPTELYDESTEVGVVAPDGQETAQLEGYLLEAFDARFQFDTVSVEDAVDEADEGTYDVYVVQSLGDDEALAEDFAEETKSPDIGVVYLEQDGEPTDAIGDLSDATDNPRTVEQFVDLGNSPINYVVKEDHPIFDGVADEGDAVELYTPTPVLNTGYFHAYFEDYEGDVYSENLAMTSYEETTHIPPFPPTTDYVETGTGLTVEDNSRTVLAASLAPSIWVEPGVFTSDAAQILQNAVSHASSPPPVYVSESQDDRIDPGTEETVSVTADGLDKIRVDLVSSTLDETDLDLEINGSINAFGEYRGLEEPTDVEDFDLTVTADGDVVGDFALEVTAVTVDEDGETETTTARTGSTSVYEAPLTVGSDDSDLESLDDALDLVVSNGEITLKDGIYSNVADTDDAYDPGYVVDTSGVTIRAAAGATPIVTFGDDDGSLSNDVLDVKADDVTIDGLNLNAHENGTAAGEFTALYSEGYSGLSVTNSTIAGDRGVYVVEVEGLEVRDTEVTDLGGFGAFNTRHPSPSFGIPGGLNENVVIDNVTVHAPSTLSENLYLSESEDVVVRNSEFAGELNFKDSNVTLVNNTVDAHGDRGVLLGGDTHAADNVVTNATTGIAAGGSTLLGVTGYDATMHVVDNRVEDADVGVSVADTVDAAEVTTNELNADDGVVFTSPSSISDEFDVASTTTDIYYNNVSGSDRGFFVDDTADGATIDARLNYVGDDKPAAAGNVTYEPYLTESPTNETLPAPENATAIGVDLEFEAGDVTAVGVPGPTTQTVDELFTDDFEGAVYGFDAASQSWTQLTTNDGLDALDALIVVAETDAHAHLEFTSGDVPPGPGQTSLVEGWNFVAAPTYGSVDEAFDLATTEFSLAAHSYDRPQGQLAPTGDLDGTYAMNGDGPRVSPFEGTFVFAEGDGTMPARLTSDPTTDHLYDDLGAGDLQEMNDGDASATEYTVADVLKSDLEGERLETALVDVLHQRMQDALDDDATRTDAIAVAESVRTTAIDDAESDQEAVAEAADAAEMRLLVEEFDIDGQFAVSQTDATSAEALLDHVNETDGEISEERLSQVVYGQFERALSNADDPRTALSSTAAEIVAEADAERVGLVETAMENALQQILADEFSGEPEEDAIEDAVQRILADEFPDESDESQDGDSDGTASASVTAPTALAG